MSHYDPNIIEPKWQQHWKDTHAFRAVEDPDKPKYYARPFATQSGEINLQVIGRIPPSRYSDYIDD